MLDRVYHSNRTFRNGIDEVVSPHVYVFFVQGVGLSVTSRNGELNFKML